MMAARNTKVASGCGPALPDMQQTLYVASGITRSLHPVVLDAEAET